MRLKYITLITAIAVASLPLAASAKEIDTTYTPSLIISENPGSQGAAAAFISSVANKHQGIKDLRANAMPDKFEKDAAGNVTKIKANGYEMTFRPSQEAWAKQDPTAYDAVVTRLDVNALISVTTIAEVTENNAKRLVLREVHYGGAIGNTNRTTKPEGQISRREYQSPQPGTVIRTDSQEIKGKIVPIRRESDISILFEPPMQISRSIREEFDADAGKWNKIVDYRSEERDWGKDQGKLSRMIQDPDGEAKISEQEYYPAADRKDKNPPPSAGKLKKQITPDGITKNFQYLGEEEIVETHNPDGMVQRRSEIKSPKTNTHMITEHENDVETRRVVTKVEGDLTTTTISKPGKPDMVDTIEVYPKGHEFAGRQKRLYFAEHKYLLNMEYTRLEGGGSRIVTVTEKEVNGKMVMEERRTDTYNHINELMDTKTEEFPPP